MSGNTSRKILIQWVRSGIGFPRRAKKIVRSLGFRRLRQVVERPDTPQIRGLIARVPHLVQVVEAIKKPAWLTTPEYTVREAENKPARAASELEAAAPAPAKSEAAAVPAPGGEISEERGEAAAGSKPKRGAKPDEHAQAKRSAKTDKGEKTKAAKGRPAQSEAKKSKPARASEKKGKK